MEILIKIDFENNANTIVTMATKNRHFSMVTTVICVALNHFSLKF